MTNAPTPPVTNAPTPPVTNAPTPPVTNAPTTSPTNASLLLVLYKSHAQNEAITTVEACGHSSVTVQWAGYHDLNEAPSANCPSVPLRVIDATFYASGHTTTRNDLAPALPGQTRYFYCSLHCASSHAQFKVHCPSNTTWTIAPTVAPSSSPTAAPTAAPTVSQTYAPSSTPTSPPDEDANVAVIVAATVGALALCAAVYSRFRPRHESTRPLRFEQEAVVSAHSPLHRLRF